MHFDLTAEQRAIQELAQKLTQEYITPYAGTWDQTVAFPMHVFKKAANLGLAGLYVDATYGGSQVTRLEGALVFEALAYGCVSTAAYLSVHNMVAGVIQRFGTQTQHQTWLPMLARGETLTSYCLTEPSAGSDAAALCTKAVSSGTDYLVSGEKAFISGAGVSGLYLCMVRTGEPGPKGVSALLIPHDSAGITVGEPEDKMGWRAQPTAALSFDRVRVSQQNRLGAEGAGFGIAMAALDGGRVNIAACALGGAQRCLDLAHTYVQTRRQFGRPLAEFQTIQFKLADMATQLTAARMMVYRAAWLLTQKDPSATIACAMAKQFATDTAMFIADAALQMHGGYGYTRDYPVERFFRDLRVLPIVEGTNEIMRCIIAKQQ